MFIDGVDCDHSTRILQYGVMVTERQDGDLHMVKKEEALEKQQLTGPYPLSKVILPLSVS